MEEGSSETADVERIDAVADDLNEEMREVLEHQSDWPDEVPAVP